MNHLKQSFGVTALVAVLVIVGSFILLWRGVSASLETLIGSWISAIIAAIVVLKSAKPNTKE
jgi:hypothetical protein